MFENIIEQGAVSQLKEDIIKGVCAPSMLFYGPENTGKGSAALELSRIFSCTQDASWKCTCPECKQHRYLQHDDLLIMGKKSFSADINAFCSVFLKNPASQSHKLLFYRSLRKLQLRFSPVLMEDDPKFPKISSALQSFDEGLNEFLLLNETEKNNLEKLCKTIVKDAVFLDENGISFQIPVGQIRRAAYWCRLSPGGKRKTLIIENSENMRNEANNSLLKLLEEPPANVSIVLSAQRREALIPTILSRLRPYRFLKRSQEGEKEILRRVFQMSPDSETAEAKSRETTGSLVTAYLDSFIQGNTEKLYPLAAWFVVSVARLALYSIKKSNKNIPQFLFKLGERYAPIAESSGFERTLKSAVLVKTILTKSGNFEDDSFSRFLKLILELVADASKEETSPEFINISGIFKKYTGEAAAAVDVLNQSVPLALEALLYNLKTSICRGQNG